jgi:hypothetical protein
MARSSAVRERNSLASRCELSSDPNVVHDFRKVGEHNEDVG